MATTKFDLKQKIWFMYENKPKEEAVKKIVLTDKGEYYDTDTRSSLHQSDAFSTKEELRDKVFSS